jgi:hypothetical protein
MIARWIEMQPNSTTTSQPAAEPAAGADPWTQRRKPPREDDKSLTSETHHWLHKIPSGLHPKRLGRQFPRVTNRIAQAWNDVAETEELFEELLVDRRGGRRGFPQPIVIELQRLRQLHRNRQRVGWFVIRRR